jgi:TonB family protein
VRYCYEQELAKQADLSGRVMVQFTIAASGQVIASVLQSSTLGNARVENCTVQAVRRWEFPKPLGGGIVIVVVSVRDDARRRGRGAARAASEPRRTRPPRRSSEALATLAEGAGAAQIERISSLLGPAQASRAPRRWPGPSPARRDVRDAPAGRRGCSSAQAPP